MSSDFPADMFPPVDHSAPRKDWRPKPTINPFRGDLIDDYEDLLRRIADMVGCDGDFEDIPDAVAAALNERGATAKADAILANPNNGFEKLRTRRAT